MNKCTKNMSLDECELTILRSAIDQAKENTGKRQLRSPEIKKIIKIVEDFIADNKLICYGGTAINNILPKSAQFYNKDLELPDYDFSPNALDHAKKLANIYYDAGFTEVEAKSGVHYGTFKVYVNFIPVADITLIDKKLFNAIGKEAIAKNKILYCPPNYLRMAMYLELSRPNGDTSRWEKVLKRLILLNNYYPIKSKKLSVKNNTLKINELYEKIKLFLIKENSVFFGSYANALYYRYGSKEKIKNIYNNVPNFYVLSEKHKETADNLVKELKALGNKNIKTKLKHGIGEIVAPHYEVLLDDKPVVFIYEPLACHSYNVIPYKGTKMKVATIDTMLSFT